MEKTPHERAAALVEKIDRELNLSNSAFAAVLNFATDDGDFAIPKVIDGLRAQLWEIDMGPIKEPGFVFKLDAHTSRLGRFDVDA